jgi:hypothetical protein
MSRKLTIKEFFSAAVAAGMEADPRGRETIDRELQEKQKLYRESEGEDREFFDQDSLTNPYADTRILYGTGNRPIGKLAVGIDIGPGEMVLLDRLNQQGGEIDLMVSHHPVGRAYANFYEVMTMQADMLSLQGVPITQAEGALKKRIQEVSRKVSAANHNRVVDAARLLDIPLCCMHTVADNQVFTHLTGLFREQAPFRVKDILELLMGLEEYRAARRLNTGPAVFSGDKQNRCGKIVVDMTGGTTGSKDGIAQLALSGTGTLVVMHLPDEYRKICEDKHMNVVCAGHIASDSLGLNLLFRRIKQKTGGGFEVLPLSGYTFFE